jgi:hypothetical protein
VAGSRLAGDAHSGSPLMFNSLMFNFMMLRVEDCIARGEERLE